MASETDGVIAWRGTPWITAKGYRRGRVRGHPWPRKSGQVYEHVAVMELHLGRKLERHETVHHIDEDKLHNLAPNLEVREIADHTRYHNARAKQRLVAATVLSPVAHADDPYDDLDF